MITLEYKTFNKALDVAKEEERKGNTVRIICGDVYTLFIK